MSGEAGTASLFPPISQIACQPVGAAETGRQSP